MSDDEDAESKTEEATEKKIRDAVDRGSTPVAREVNAAFGVWAICGCLAFFVANRSARFFETMGLLFANAGALKLASDSDAYLFVSILGAEMFAFLAPLVIVILLAGVAAGIVQGAPQIVVDRIMPQLERVSPRAGLRRLLALSAVMEVGKSLAKMLVIGGAVAIVGVGDRSIYVDAMRMEARSLPGLALRLLLHLVSAVAIALTVLAATDFVWSRLKWRRDLRMSRQEVKEEFKQAEGDPLVKARLRSLAMDRSRRRMIASVPKASLVIANPTHYAVALRYRREEGGAPLVLAKGKDLVALKIREAAERNGVPVLERKELARAMFDIVEVDQMIPEAFYRPVAELIHFLEAEAARRRH